jgi:hypothetical protein
MAWRSGQAYSEDLRAKVLAAVDRGQGVYPVAALFGVSVSYIYKALARQRASGIATSLPARPRGRIKRAMRRGQISRRAYEKLAPSVIILIGHHDRDENERQEGARHSTGDRGL